MAYANPVLRLPSARLLKALDEQQKDALIDVLCDIGRDADVKAEESWKRRKGPMAAYWRAVGVYARHIARACGPTRGGGS